MAAGDRMEDSGSVDRVMNQVLSAEQEARMAVERCRAEAARILADAEERARRIGHRTERRIRLAHRIADRAVKREQKGLRGSDPGFGPEVSAGEAREVLDGAVDALVEEMLDGPS